MNAKEYLNRGFRMDREIDAKMMQIAQLRSLATRIAPDIRRERVTGSTNAASMEDTVIRIIEMEEELNREIDAYVDVKREIAETIAGVADDNCRIVPEMRYLGYMKMKETGEKIGYTERAVRRIHRRGLERVAAILNKVVRPGPVGSGQVLFHPGEKSDKITM